MRWCAGGAAPDGRIEIDSNAAERALRTIAILRKNYIVAGSDAGGVRCQPA
jgi:transposase